jgi:hypothetical protein
MHRMLIYEESNHDVVKSWGRDVPKRHAFQSSYGRSHLRLARILRSQNGCGTRDHPRTVLEQRLHADGAFRENPAINRADDLQSTVRFEYIHRFCEHVGDEDLRNCAQRNRTCYASRKHIVNRAWPFRRAFRRHIDPTRVDGHREYGDGTVVVDYDSALRLIVSTAVVILTHSDSEAEDLPRPRARCTVPDGSLSDRSNRRSRRGAQSAAVSS